MKILSGTALGLTEKPVGWLPSSQGRVISEPGVVGIKYGNQNWEGGDFALSWAQVWIPRVTSWRRPWSHLTLTPSESFLLGGVQGPRDGGGGPVWGLGTFSPSVPSEVKLRPCKTQLLCAPGEAGPRGPGGCWERRRPQAGSPGSRPHHLEAWEEPLSSEPQKWLKAGPPAGLPHFPLLSVHCSCKYRGFPWWAGGLTR